MAFENRLTEAGSGLRKEPLSQAELKSLAEPNSRKWTDAELRRVTRVMDILIRVDQRRKAQKSGIKSQ